MKRRLALRLALAVVAIQISHAAPAAEAILVNRLGFGLAAIYAHAPGNEPWKIAGPLAAGETAKVDTSTPQGSRRLIVEMDGDAPALQFFNTSYLGDAARMELAMRRAEGGGDRVPTLLVVESGQRGRTVAGLPFDILLSYLESENGLAAPLYAELMTPLAADGRESIEFAVSSRNSSWRLLPPGPVFREGEDGEHSLASIAFGADLPRPALFDFLGEFDGTLAVPALVLLGDGTAYAFNDREAAENPGAVSVEGTRDADAETLWEILKDGLNNWIRTHGSAEQPGTRLFPESPETRCELRIAFCFRSAATAGKNSPPNGISPSTQAGQSMKWMSSPARAMSSAKRRPRTGGGIIMTTGRC